MKKNKLVNSAKQSNKISSFAKKYINYLYEVFNTLNFKELEKLDAELLDLRKKGSPSLSSVTAKSWPTILVLTFSKKQKLRKRLKFFL